MNTTFERRRDHVSLFWPVMLIGIGIIFLLANSGQLTHDPVALLVQFWPVIFVVIGIDLLFARTGWIGALVSALLALLIVGGAIVYLITPGQTLVFSGWQIPNRADLSTMHVEQPLQGVTEATVKWTVGSGESVIRAANTTDVSYLIDGDVAYRGELTNQIQRSDGKATVTLANEDSFVSWPWFLNDRTRWDLRLNPTVRYDFDLSFGSGNHTVDLSDLVINGVSLAQGSGNNTLKLPEGGSYQVALTVNSGDLLVRVPAGMPVQINYQVNSGDLNILALGNEFRRTNGDGRHGTYASATYQADRAHIDIDLQLNSGDVTLQD